MELNRYNNFIDILACVGRILSLTFIYQPGHPRTNTCHTLWMEGKNLSHSDMGMGI